jgi:hypothetical protein
MSKIIISVILLLLAGCKSITSCFLIEFKGLCPEDTKLLRSPEHQKEIDALLAADAENKKWEKTYLKEIKAAQLNSDHGAYYFFLEEFIKAPRLILPEWMKKEPGYVPALNVKDIEGFKK